MSVRAAEALGWLALVVLLAVLVPPFLCLPLTADAAFYDTCARHVLRGGALECDLLFLPPPGMPWAMAAVRAALGGSSVALRAADLVVAAGIIALLAGWLRAMGLPRAALVWLAVVLAAVYLTTTEWLQVQPDMWMLLPALVALHLRRRQVLAIASSAGPGRLAAGAALEGVCWAAACLIKPFVLVPALACWLASLPLARQASRRRGPPALDAAGLLAGGLLVGAAWQGWLLSSGSWSHYWHTFLDYRGDYYSITQPWWRRLQFVFTGIFPWTPIHLPGLLVAVSALTLGVLRRPKAFPANPTRLGTVLLAALYLGWVVQANWIQSQMAYQLLPTLLLVIALLVGSANGIGLRRAGRLGLFGVGVVLVAAVCQPASHWERMALWGRCVCEGSSPEVKNGLVLDKTYIGTADWVELERVADFLRAQDTKDGELTCYCPSTIHLYTKLRLRPAVPFLYPSVYLEQFPGHRASITRAIRNSAQRFIVTDSRDTGLGVEESAPEEEKAKVYPLGEPVVFRAGRYAVHRAGR